MRGLSGHCNARVITHHTRKTFRTHLVLVTAENYSVFYTQMIEGLEACVNDKPIRVIE